MKKILLSAVALASALFTAQAQSSVTTGGQRHVVIEDVTGAWCQYCPDGTVKQEIVLVAQPKAIGTGMHNADKMSFADANLVMASPNLVCGYPGGLVNRANWGGAYTGPGTCTTATSVSRTYWQTLADQVAAQSPKWDVTMTHTYQAATIHSVLNNAA